MDINSIDKMARIAGLLFLVVVITPLFSLVFIDPKIAVEGDVLATARAVVGREFLFRLNTTISLFMFIGVVPLSVALYEVLKTVSKPLANLALQLRIAEAIVGMIAVLGNLVLLNFVSGEGYLEQFGSKPYQNLTELITSIYWEATIIVFILLALGSIINFILFLKSGMIPKGLSLFGIISYVLVFIGALYSLLFSGDAYMMLGAPTVIFEIVIGSWLLFKGVRLGA